MSCKLGAWLDCGGGFGKLDTNVLKYFGAYVVATSNTRNVARIEALGVDEVIDHERSDFTRSGAQFDVVFDAVGKSSFGACKRLLVPRGIYISTDLGPLAQNPIYGLASPLFALAGESEDAATTAGATCSSRPKP